jgi:uncharacterized protein
MPRQQSVATICRWLLAWVLITSPQMARAQEPNAESLVAAVRAGDAQRVRSALKRGVDPDAIDANGWTALIHAAAGNQIEIADLLIEAGANVNARTQDGATPLMAAAVMGHARMAQTLLDDGADPTLRNKNGADARVKAEEYGHANVVALLDAMTEGKPKVTESPAAEVTPTVTPPAVEARARPAPLAATPAERAVDAPEPVSGTQPAAKTPAPPKAAKPERKAVKPERGAPVEAIFLVLRDAVVRKGADQGAEGIDTLAEGTRVFVRKRVRNWYQVEYDDRVGYIHERLLGRLREIGSPLPLERGDTAQEVSPLVLASGRWATPGNPSMCSHDFLEVRFIDNRMTLIVNSAGERTVLAEGLPILEMKDGHIEAGDSRLTWRFTVTSAELRYQMGSSNTVRYVRCPES